MSLEPARSRGPLRAASTAHRVSVGEESAAFRPASAGQMPFVRRLLRNPQSLWVRKALFQVHLWTGIGVGLYILLICVSGSVLVYRSELLRTFSKRPTIVAASGQRMTPEDLTKAAQHGYPGYEVTEVWQPKNPNQAVEISLKRGQGTTIRLFHPYSGEDLGNKLRVGYRFTMWLLDFHDNLLFGHSGRLVNGIGALLVVLLSLTGAVIWWPGIKKWRRSLSIGWRANWKRLNWDLHSAVGFWTFAFVFMWGISGIYFAFPDPFQAVVDFFDPYDSLQRQPRVGDTMLAWLARLHFGRFAGWSVKALWAFFGLVPPFLFVTGGLMWWNRVIRHGPRQFE
jgi:uncharacterized iron-regulated membrane protein